MKVRSIWPNPIKVDYCGKKLKERICDDKSKEPADPNEMKLKFCFTPLSECPSGYLVDNGKTLQL